MENYLVLSENIIKIAYIGITICDECKNHDIQSLCIDKTTTNKYLYCHKCKRFRKLEQYEFDSLLVYSKYVPQNEDVLIKIWASLMDINQKYTIEYINKNASKGYEQVRDELYQLVTYKSIELYDALPSRFLKNISEESVDCFTIMLFNRIEKSEKIDKINKIEKAKKSKKPIKIKETQSSSRKKLENFMKTNYQNTIRNILEEEPKLFKKMELNFEIVVSEDNQNSAIIRDYNKQFNNISEELFSIKIVNSICQLYKFVENYKMEWPDYNEYYIRKIHKVELGINTDEVSIDKISGSFFIDESEKTKIIIKSFENILNIFTKENIKKYKEQDKFHANLIKDFIENRYYEYGPDLGTAIFIYKNKEYFDKYIYKEIDYIKIINTIKKIKKEDSKNIHNNNLSKEIHKNETNTYKEDSNYIISDSKSSTKIIKEYEEDKEQQIIKKYHNSEIDNFTQEEKSNSNWGFWLSIVAIFINIISFFSLYKSYKAIKSMKETGKKYNKLAIAGLVISSLYVAKYIYVITTWITYLTINL